MYKIDFQKPVLIHFIGIGGISMSGLAEILLERGFTVHGSDTHPSALTKKLEEEGAVISYGQRPENIAAGTACVVYTAAISEDNPEWAAAKCSGVPMLSRAELLGQLMTNYALPVAVSGTHGKTTTTSMLSHILLSADADPTISVGGILKAIGGNIRVGSSDVFLTEACEYTNSFLHFSPKISLILNIEEDHMDFFRDLADIRHSFTRFAARTPADGAVIISADIADYREICADTAAAVVTFGTAPDADYRAEDIAYDSEGCVSFTLIRKGEREGRIALHVGGSHNVQNALAAIAAADLLAIPRAAVEAGLTSFGGTDRRFEYKGSFSGVTVVDDYAHHPTEIAATLQAAVHYPHNELWVVFQPHTYTRTKAFFHEFAEALTAADHLIFAEIYAARETDTLGLSSADLAEEARRLGADARFFADFPSIEAYLKENCRPGDLVITMGAGDVVNVAEDLLA